MHLTVDGRPVEVVDSDLSLLDALREQLGNRSAKDGCSPQGQCGCCTVLVDGAPRVACVTPVRRMAGRAVTTVEGLDPEVRDRLVAAFADTGASQCGFCTPGILCRLASLGPNPTKGRVERALLAHLCRCTGWRTIVQAAAAGTDPPDRDRVHQRDEAAAGRRATLEGGSPQRVGPAVAAGRGGFADDTAPPGCLVAVPAVTGGWVVAETLEAARAAAGKVQGRRSGRGLIWPLEVPPGDWAVTLQTTWVEPGYLEPDASWCEPGGEPATALANGGAFGAKMDSPAPAAARRLAREHGRAVRVLLSREDVVRLGPKRPPVAAGVRADGTGVMRVVRTPGVADAVAAMAPGLVVEEVDVAGPPTSAAVRGAGWVEAAVLLAAAGAQSANRPRPASRPHPAGGLRGYGALWLDLAAGEATAQITAPSGGRAAATVRLDGAGGPAAVSVAVAAGDPLDEVVLRSYAVGAAHMALGWVFSEAVAVDGDGEPEDLTIRSFGILRARDTPEVDVTIDPSDAAPAAASDAVFAAVAAAAWGAQGLPARWPTRRPHR